MIQGDADGPVMNITVVDYRDFLGRQRWWVFRRPPIENVFRQSATVATVGELDRSVANPYLVLLPTVETVETVTERKTSAWGLKMVD